ncbi:unnamed protein product [Trifolium pratense]|uniref:Uncharacterized protein n=1 Tax=Trifolium pratense TaxID=57577 RepID=A0ACB0LH68_TRIPR|nr:unnamed protein product [Trifolium pratense]
MNFVKKNGEVRLPPGFRFHPTDEELVVEYLKRDLEQERYFFSTKEPKYPNGNRSNRATNSGYWKATGLDKHISNVGGGIKKTLVFYKGKPPHGSRTDWIMHEYRLTPSNYSNSNPMNENWVLCRIFLKRRGGSNSKNGEDSSSTIPSLLLGVKPKGGQEVEVNNNNNNNSSSKVLVFYDFLAQNNNTTDAYSSSSSISPATSGITDELGEHENEDSSSSFTILPSCLTNKQP